MKRNGFSLIEILTVIAIISVLTSVLVVATQGFRRSAMSTQSLSNIRMLALANQAYAAEHGTFAPAQNPQNSKRWHGSGGGGSFEFREGYLTPYLENNADIVRCPVFETYPQADASFENGSGGYGYNASYIGGSPWLPGHGTRFMPARPSEIVSPSTTVMFTDTAMARGDGLQEYPYSEPYRAVQPGSLGGQLIPSVHFRHGGKAHVAWCDASVTAVEPTELGGSNFYGGDSAEAGIGWFGPKEDNGFWNHRNRLASQY